MESLENKIIRDKIIKVENLPKEYETSLDSKFELLMLGVQANSNRFRKRSFIPWIIAAGILLLFFINLPQKNTEKIIVNSIKVTNTSLKRNRPTISPEHSNDMNEIQQNHSNKLKYFISSSRTDSIVQTKDSVQQASQEMIAAAATDTTNSSSVVRIEKIKPSQAKKHRFVEIDFNDGPKSEAMESENISGRFKLDIKFNWNNNLVQSSTPKQLQIKKDF